METVTIFPSLIAREKQFISLAIAQEIKEYILKDDVNHRKHSSLTNNSVSSHKLKEDFLGRLENDISSCKDIKTNIEKVVNEFSNMYGYYHKGISNSWYNIQGVGSTLKEHTHPMSAISGAIYINVDEKSSKLTFFNPNLHTKYNVTSQFNTIFNSSQITIIPKIGDLVLFPSWMEHGSHGEVNNTENRIVLSFNIKPLMNKDNL